MVNDMKDTYLLFPFKDVCTFVPFFHIVWVTCKVKRGKESVILIASLLVSQAIVIHDHEDMSVEKLEHFALTLAG